MLIRDSSTCPHAPVIDRSVLCELLHPDKTPDASALACSIAHAIVPKGESTLPHRLLKSTELYYILKGTGCMKIEGESSTVRPGQIVLIPPGAVQNIRNTGTCDLVFLCIVSPKWQARDEELVTVG
jgi:mannose-6-phosphate isomerase-like protein (cupin superfamily)